MPGRPTTPRRPSRRSLADYSLAEALAFLAGWLPPGHPGRIIGPANWTSTRWQSWREYLDDFALLEGELRQRFPRKPVMFADKALAYRRRHGAAALDGATYEAIKYDGEADA